MPKYRVRDNQILAHAGAVHEAGAVIDLPRTVADDPAVRGLLDELDAAGQPVAPRSTDDLERFRAHERVGFLRDRLVAAQATVAELQQRLAAEEKILTDEVAKLTAPSRASKASPAAPKE